MTTTNPAIPDEPVSGNELNNTDQPYAVEHDPARRALLRGLAGAAAAATVARVATAATTQTATLAGLTPGKLTMATLGRKKTPITKFCVGGWHAGNSLPRPDAVKMLRRAYDLGITFFDSARSYGDSESRLGEALSDVRGKIVLMTKSQQRDATGAERELTKSLSEMKTDHVDLWQFHSINSVADAEKIAKSGGAADLARKAMADGRIRILGATGHNSPEGLLRLLELVPEIEVMQFPVNCVDSYYKPFMSTVLPVCNKKGIDVIAMKCLAMGSLAKAKGLTVAEIHRYALSQSITSWVSGVESIAQLEENLLLAETFTPMSAEEQKALIARAEPYHGPKFEGYKNWN